MDALVAAQPRLGELVAAAGESKSTSDGLFLRRATQHTSSEPMATLSMRLLSPNVAAIDDLVEQHNAPSRSALCLAALRSYLHDPDA